MASCKDSHLDPLRLGNWSLSAGHPGDPPSREDSFPPLVGGVLRTEAVAVDFASFRTS